MASRCLKPAKRSDTRYVWAESCTWHGPIAEAGKRADGQPCCPACGSELFEVSGEEVFWELLQALAAITDLERLMPDYEARARWGRGKCFPDNEALTKAYDTAVEVQR